MRVVVDVALPQVFPLRILVGLVIVVDGRVVVLVTVGRLEVLPGLPMPLVVDNVRVLVLMQQLLVSMCHDSSLSRRNTTIVWPLRIPR